MDNQTNSDIQDEVAIRLWDGDETVIAEILVQYAPCLEKALGGKYPSFSSQDLEDIVSEAIKRLWAKRNEYDDSKGSVRCLLYWIADNCAKDILKSGWQKLQDRRKNFYDDSLEEMIGTETVDAKEKEVPDNYDSKINKDLRTIVKNLPDIQQKIVWAFALAPEGEINAPMLSKELGYPAGTIRQYLKRAKDTIRAEMKKRGHDLS
jgi:RNA polymerase sigma factor (sigma-70 family)